MAEATRLYAALDVAGQPVIVIGGGSVAERKLETLLAAGAALTVIAPDVTDKIAAQVGEHGLVHHARRYQSGDLAGARLVFAATDEPDVNEQIAAEARAAGVFCNVAAPAEAGDLQIMATVQRDQVTIALSTGGASPFVAARLRAMVESAVPLELACLARLMGELRSEVGRQVASQAKRRAVYEAMWSSDAAARLAAGDEAGARAILRAVLERA